jgi:hypothetical protein
MPNLEKKSAVNRKIISDAPVGQWVGYFASVPLRMTILWEN